MLFFTWIILFLFVCFVECESAIVYFFIRLLFTTYYRLPITSVSTLFFRVLSEFAVLLFCLTELPKCVCVFYHLYIINIYVVGYDLKQEKMGILGDGYENIQ